jgi:hypothetical protein
MTDLLHIRPPLNAVHRLTLLAHRNSYAILQRIQRYHKNSSSNFLPVSMTFSLLFHCHVLLPQGRPRILTYPALFKFTISIPSYPCTVLAHSISTTTSSSTNMPTHSVTPYVTPHILHKHYAQAYDNENVSKCTFRLYPHVNWP